MDSHVKHKKEWVKIQNCLTFLSNHQLPSNTVSTDVSLNERVNSVSLSAYTYACVLSHVQLLGIPCHRSHQAPLPMKFFMQEHWSGLPFPPPGHLPDTGIKPAFLLSPTLACRFFTTAPPLCVCVCVCNCYSQFSLLMKLCLGKC